MAHSHGIQVGIETKIADVSHMLVKNLAPNEIILAGDFAWGIPTQKSKIELLILFRWWHGNSCDNYFFFGTKESHANHILRHLPYRDEIIMIFETRSSIEAEIWCEGFENDNHTFWRHLKEGTILYKRPWWQLI